MLDGKPNGVALFYITDKTSVMIQRDMRRGRAWWIRDAQDRKKRRERPGTTFLQPRDDSDRVGNVGTDGAKRVSPTETLRNKEKVGSQGQKQTRAPVAQLDRASDF